jgi:hypothetical protein
MLHLLLLLLLVGSRYLSLLLVLIWCSAQWYSGFFIGLGAGKLSRQQCRY